MLRLGARAQYAGYSDSVRSNFRRRKVVGKIHQGTRRPEFDANLMKQLAVCNAFRGVESRPRFLVRKRTEPTRYVRVEIHVKFQTEAPCAPSNSGGLETTRTSTARVEASRCDAMRGERGGDVTRRERTCVGEGEVSREGWRTRASPGNFGLALAV